MLRPLQHRDFELLPETGGTTTGLITVSSAGLMLATPGRAYLVSPTLQVLREYTTPRLGTQWELPEEIARRDDGSMLSSSGHCFDARGASEECLEFKRFQKFQDRPDIFCHPGPRTHVRAIGKLLLFLTRCVRFVPDTQDEAQLIILR